MSNAAPAQTVLPPAYANPAFSDSACGVALEIANHLAAVPMLREMLAVKDAALAAAKRDAAAKDAEIARLRAELDMAGRVAAGLARKVIATEDTAMAVVRGQR